MVPFEPPKPVCWEYDLPGGWRVLAGRTDVDNDLLTLKTARPNDWWFHVKGVPGSHVILCHEEAAEPGRETLDRAAAVAAWHSKARNGGTVAVICTQAKNVTKPRGARPGQVCSKRDRILKVQPGLPT